MYKIFGFGLGIVAMIVLLSVQAKLAGVQAASTPSTYFLLSGSVWYKVHDNLVPATYGGVRITATSRHQTYTQPVDGNGRYTLPVEHGEYRIQASNLLRNRFDPVKYVLRVTSDVGNLNFIGK